MNCITRIRVQTNMKSQHANLRRQRIEESYHINLKYCGDRRAYAVGKTLQEAEKRRKQNLVPAFVVEQQFKLHQERYPTWFQVQDASGNYCVPRLLESSADADAKRCYRLPIDFETGDDLFSIAKDLISKEVPVDALHINVSFANTTLFCPQKMVLLQHELSGEVFPQAIKHQPRHLGPFLIRDIVGGVFDDDERAIFITKDTMSHTRYLHGSFGKIQFHSGLPKFDKDMRVCYGVLPQSVDAITVCVGDIRIVIHHALCDEWTIKKDSVVTAVESFIHFG